MVKGKNDIMHSKVFTTVSDNYWFPNTNCYSDCCGSYYFLDPLPTCGKCMGVKKLAYLSEAQMNFFALEWTDGSISGVLPQELFHEHG